MPLVDLIPRQGRGFRADPFVVFVEKAIGDSVEVDSPKKVLNLFGVANACIDQFLSLVFW